MRTVSKGTARIESPVPIVQTEPAQRFLAYEPNRANRTVGTECEPVHRVEWRGHLRGTGMGVLGGDREGGPELSGIRFKNGVSGGGSSPAS